MTEIKFRRLKGRLPDQYGLAVKITINNALLKTARYAENRLRQVVPASQQAQTGFRGRLNTLIDSGIKITTTAKAYSLTIEINDILIYQEIGRPRSAKLAPIDIITRWVIKSGISSDGIIARQIAFAIARSWQQKGKKALGYLGLAVAGSIPASKTLAKNPVLIPGGTIKRILDKFDAELQLGLDAL